MPIPTKLGSRNTAGGIAMMGDTSVLINGRQASRIGDYVTGHPGFDPRHPHPPNPIVTGSHNVIVGGRPLGYLSVLDACRHIMIPHESDVLIGQ